MFWAGACPPAHPCLISATLTSARTHLTDAMGLTRGRQVPFSWRFLTGLHYLMLWYGVKYHPWALVFKYHFHNWCTVLRSCGAIWTWVLAGRHWAIGTSLKGYGPGQLSSQALCFLWQKQCSQVPHTHAGCHDQEPSCHVFL